MLFMKYRINPNKLKLSKLLKPHYQIKYSPIEEEEKPKKENKHHLKTESFSKVFFNSHEKPEKDKIKINKLFYQGYKNMNQKHKESYSQQTTSATNSNLHEYTMDPGTLFSIGSTKLLKK
jgi:GTPase SAR1 family protein